MRVLLLLSAILLVSATTVAAVQIINRDIAFTRLETEISFWGRGDYVPTVATRQATEHAMQRLGQCNPHNPGVLSLHATQRAWEAYWARDAAARQTLAVSAAHRQYLAQQQRPAYRQGWELLHRYATDAGSLEMRQLASRQLDLLAPAP